MPQHVGQLEGASDRPQWRAQVRVMPRCWFALLRFWLRVDGVLVRLYEARLMAELGGRPGAPLVRRELRHCEGEFAKLASAGAPPARVRLEALPQGPSLTPYCTSTSWGLLERAAFSMQQDRAP